MKYPLLVAGLALGASATALASAFTHEVVHFNHAGAHTTADGHVAVQHDGHVDHVHDGHLHSVHLDHVDEHAINVSSTNPAAEEIVSRVDDGDHAHSTDGDHPQIQHGEHFDYIHDGRLHFVHGDHVDDHGPVTLVD